MTGSEELGSPVKSLDIVPFVFFENEVYVLEKKSTNGNLIGLQSWQLYWCKVSDMGLLFYSSRESDIQSFRIRADSTLSIREEVEAKELPELKGSVPLGFIVQGQGKNFILAAAAENTRQMWLKEICSLIRDIMIPLLQPTKLESWETEDVCLWLESIGLGQYGATMREHNVTGKEVEKLSKNTLDKYGITKLGHKLRILKGLEEIQELYNEEVEPVSASLTSVSDSNISVGMVQMSTVVICTFKGKTLRLRIEEESSFEDLVAKLRRFYQFPFHIMFKNDRDEMERMENTGGFYKAQFCMNDNILRLEIRKKKDKGKDKEKKRDRKEKEKDRSKRKKLGKKDSAREGDSEKKSKSKKTKKYTEGEAEKPKEKKQKEYAEESDKGRKKTNTSGGSFSQASTFTFLPIPVSLAIVKSHYMGKVKYFSCNTDMSFDDFKMKLKERHSLVELPWMVGRIPVKEDTTRKLALFSEDKYIEWLATGGIPTQTDSKARQYELWIETDLSRFKQGD